MLKNLIIVYLTLCSCHPTKSRNSEQKALSNKRGLSALCQKVDVRNIGKSVWPSIGSTVGSITAQSSIQKAFPATASKAAIEQFSKTQPSYKSAMTTNNKGQRENVLSLFWSKEEFNEAFSKACGGFKDGADTCLLEMVKDLDGEFMTKKGVVRAGVEIKKFEADKADMCSLRTQEAEFKAGLCIPLAPAAIVATGSIFGAINLYLDFGVRVQSATNLSNKTILKEANPMFECGAQCDLPFLKAEMAFTEEGFKFEKQVTVSSTVGPKNVPIQSRSEVNITYEEMSEWMQKNWDEVKLENVKIYMKEYYEKQKKYWNQTDPELTRWPELICESGCF